MSGKTSLLIRNIKYLVEKNKYTEAISSLEAVLGEEERTLSGKNIGTLYHFTQLKHLPDILENDMLKKVAEDRTRSIERQKRKAGFSGVSTTRDYMGIGGSFGLLAVRIVLDGNKISNSYKIRPISDFGTPEENSRFTEHEELIEGDLKNLSSYIKQIDIKIPMSHPPNTDIDPYKLQEEYPSIKFNISGYVPEHYVQLSGGSSFYRQLGEGKYSQCLKLLKSDKHFQRYTFESINSYDSPSLLKLIKKEFAGKKGFKAKIADDVIYLRPDSYAFLASNLGKFLKDGAYSGGPQEEFYELLGIAYIRKFLNYETENFWDIQKRAQQLAEKYGGKIVTVPAGYADNSNNTRGFSKENKDLFKNEKWKNVK